MAKAKNKYKDLPGGFAGIPRIVMDSPDFQSLTGGGVKLLLELARQYTGKNNGDLTTAYSILKDRGFKSKDTITRAKDELLRLNLIVCTRSGMFTNPGGRCALYALTWQPVDDCSGKQLEISPTRTPSRKFSLERNKIPRPEIGQGSSLKSGRQQLRDSHGRYTSSSKLGRLTAIP